MISTLYTRLLQNAISQEAPKENIAMKTVIQTSRAPVPIGPYSQAIEVGSLIFVSGQLPVDPRTGDTPQGVKDQTDQSIKNLQAILTDAGSSLDDVIKTSVFLDDMSNFGAMNEIYQNYFHDNPPARSCVEVAKLPKGAAVEIEAVATTRKEQ